MKILIVDDEKPAIEHIARIINDILGEKAVVRSSTKAMEAVEIAKDFLPDIVFMDIEMPGMDGLSMAAALKKIRSDVELIVVTAYLSYSLPALKIHVSDYLLKPVDETDVREALGNLRNLDKNEELSSEKLTIQCFGNFEVYYKGKKLSFKRSRSKELLAYLVCRRGAGVTSGELCTVFWEDDDNINQKKTYIRQYYASLLKALSAVGMGHVLCHSRDSYSVDISCLECDLYEYLKNNDHSRNMYNTEFLSQYSWAELEVGVLG